MKWVKGVILAVFLASYPFTYFLGVKSEDKKWTEKYNTLVHNYNITMDGIQKVLQAKEEGFQSQLDLITSTSKQKDEEYKTQLASLERDAANSLQQSTKRANKYRSQARASEVERENLAAHCSRLDQALVEGKAVAGSLRLTLEQRENELRELGTVLKAIEKKYE